MTQGLSVETHYSDAYSECASSNSSFSGDIFTPTSSLSAATSRRHSFTFENQPHCDRGTGFRITDFSCGYSTPVEQPTNESDRHSEMLVAHMAECGVEYSPMDMETPQRPEISPMPERLPFADPFAAQTSYLCSTSQPVIDELNQNGCFDSAILVADHNVSHKPVPEWSNSFQNGYSLPCPQEEHLSAQVEFGIVCSTRIDNNFPNTVSGESRSFEEMSTPQYTSNKTVTIPQTIAPRETVVCPGTPLNQVLAAPFHTPGTRSEIDEHSSRFVRKMDPYSSGSSDGAVCGSPMEARNEAKFDLSFTNAMEERASSRYVKIQKPKKKAVSRNGVPFSHYAPTIYSSKNKQHVCLDCNIRFDRPEHCNRHKTTLSHHNRCKQLGKPINKQPMFVCVVPGCQEKDKKFTRNDNLKAHYKNTHFFEKMIQKDGKLVEIKKRNQYVSMAEAESLGIAHMDPRRPDFVAKESKKTRSTR